TAVIAAGTDSLTGSRAVPVRRVAEQSHRRAVVGEHRDHVRVELLAALRGPGHHFADVGVLDPAGVALVAHLLGGGAVHRGLPSPEGDEVRGEVDLGLDNARIDAVYSHPASASLDQMPDDVRDP